MLKLGGTDLEFRNWPADREKLIARVSDQPHRVRPLREGEAYLVKGETPPPGFRCYLAIRSHADLLAGLSDDEMQVVLPDEYDYLADGDVVRLIPGQNRIRVIYRRRSRHNSFLTTERCNNYCLMCSQPPREIDDSWIVDEILETIPLMDPATAEIGLTGGEPTLLGADFFRILKMLAAYLPRTAIHILSNGRQFADPDFAQRYAEVGHSDMMVGIPIYSDVSTVHDYVVQADGAFDETIQGILNLKRLRQRVEVRVVVHKQTYQRLPQLAEFLARNLTFVDHIALMGLEITGFTKPNRRDLWIDPADYQSELYQAATLLAGHRMHVSIYNHQLCLLDPRLMPLAKKSISDWKNEYMPECADCREMNSCGGFFSSAKLRYSDHIKPFL